MERKSEKRVKPVKVLIVKSKEKEQGDESNNSVEREELERKLAP